MSTLVANEQDKSLFDSVFAYQKFLDYPYNLVPENVDFFAVVLSVSGTVTGIPNFENFTHGRMVRTTVMFLCMISLRVGCPSTIYDAYFMIFILRISFLERLNELSASFLISRYIDLIPERA